MSKSTILIIVYRAHHHMAIVHLISLHPFLYYFTPLQTHWYALCSYKVPAPLGLGLHIGIPFLFGLLLPRCLLTHLLHTIPVPGISSIESTLLKLLLPQHAYTTPDLYPTPCFIFFGAFITI